MHQTIKNDFWEYDPGNDNWTQRENFPGIKRRGAAGFTIGNKGYMGTGFDGASRKDFWEYSLAGNGAEDIEQEARIFVFPNSFSARCTIRIESQSVSGSKAGIKNPVCVLYDVNGNKIRTVNPGPGTNDFVLERGNLPSGIYFYVLQEGNAILANGKLIIR